MNDKEIKDLLSRGTASRVDFDPALRNEITRSAMDAMIREVKGHISRKRKVSVLVIKT
jgi:hypothetical protein